jgi:hypothetical protein
MAQIVFEFGGGGIESVLGALAIAVGSGKYRVRVLPANATESLDYVLTGDTFESAGDKMRQGEITSFLIQPEEGYVSWAMCYIPNFMGGLLSIWHGALEYKLLEFESLFHRLMAVEGLRYVSVSMEEGLVLEDVHLTPALFPWDHWRLIVGAVRSDDVGQGGWHVKEGSARGYAETEHG